MLAQQSNEVIVVDFSCPQGTAQFVKQFPSVRLVEIKGEANFSNWRARNAGASVATSDVLVFVDADTVLSDSAIDGLSEHLPTKAYGLFHQNTSRAFNRSGVRLAANQLKGFHVVPAAAFRRIGGYDEVLEGYASGGDTDLEERLALLGLTRYELDATLVATVIEHDAASRTLHHSIPIRTSYATGLLYRTAKLAILKLRRQLELPWPLRSRLYAAARDAVSSLGSTQDRVSMLVTVDDQPILMPRQLGYHRGTQSLSLRIELSLEERLSNPTT